MNQPSSVREDPQSVSWIADGGQPLSIGISGGWGVGKSSMVKLIASGLHVNNPDKLVFLTFNSWLYQGHDDAKSGAYGGDWSRADGSVKG